MNAILHVHDKLDAFGLAKARLVLLLSDRRFKRTDVDYQGRVMSAIRQVSDDATAFDKKIVLETLQQVVFLGEQPMIVEVEEGATFCFHVFPEDDVSYEGYKLLARDEETGVAISDPALDGTAEREQHVYFSDFDFAEDTLRRVNVQLEQPLTVGDAVFPIAKIVMIIKRNIDWDQA